VIPSAGLGTRLFPAQVFLTFDIEDFINDRSLLVLERILEILKDEDLRGLFFITGHMADKLKSHPEIVIRLRDHDIGYHSTGHSVRPLISEFTDVEDYREAVQIAFSRETSYVSPITGELFGSGGLVSLRSLFPQNSVISYRAPGFCWSPPHLEALNKLGITHDFSTYLSAGPLRYKGTFFYPFPISLDFNLITLMRCIKLIAVQGSAILLLHPGSLVNQGDWDSIYFYGNPKELTLTQSKLPEEQKHLLNGFSFFAKSLSRLQKAGLIEVTPRFVGSKINLNPTPSLVDKLYFWGTRWSVENFNYRPRFLYSHYKRFFNLIDETSK
jgi:hypothetical protein